MEPEIVKSKRKSLTPQDPFYLFLKTVCLPPLISTFYFTERQL